MKTRMLLRALEPISHGATVRSNITLIKTQKIIQPNGRYEDVPVISANQLCNRAIRTPGIDLLVELCEIKDLTAEALQWLYNGGNLTQGGASVKIDDQQKIKELFPLFSLLGGAFVNQLLGGKLRIQNAYLCCKETKHLFGDEDQELFKESCYDQVQVETFTNMDPVRDPGKAHLLTEEIREKESKDRDKTVLMPYERTSVSVGSHWIWSISTAYKLSTIEQGCLNYSLNAWDGYIGGRSSRGFGKMEKVNGKNLTSFVDKYKQHLIDNKQAIQEHLHSEILK